MESVWLAVRRSMAQGGARNFRDLATPTSAPLEGRIYTCGVDLDSVDFDKVITHPSLYKRNVGKSQIAQATDRPRDTVD